MNNKIKALYQYLQTKNKNITVSEYDENTFILNERQELQGTSPAEYEKQIAEFKKIIDPVSPHFRRGGAKSINEFLKLSTQKQEAQKDRFYKIIEQTIPKEPVIKGAFYNTNILYHLLNGHKQYIEAWKTGKVSEYRELHTVDDGEYMVLTDEEADDKLEEYLDNYLENCIYPELSGTARAYFNDEAWREDARMDGRGNSLASYDGAENNEEVDGTTYYIYRTN